MVYEKILLKTDLNLRGDCTFSVGKFTRSSTNSLSLVGVVGSTRSLLLIYYPYWLKSIAVVESLDLLGYFIDADSRALKSHWIQQTSKQLPCLNPADEGRFFCPDHAEMVVRIVPKSASG